MALILAIGSNIGDRKSHLENAIKELSKSFKLIKQSHVYESKAVDYLDQPDFYNQVLEFESPDIDAHEVLKITMDIEANLGRERIINRGPRTIDIDILFYKQEIINTEDLQVPHPRWNERSFVIIPLMELPFYRANKEALNANESIDQSELIKLP